MTVQLYLCNFYLIKINNDKITMTQLITRKERKTEESISEY